MNAWMPKYALACLACLLANTAQAQPAKEASPVLLVGRVIIVGNTVTRDEVIREQLNLFPGQVLRFPELTLAARRLARLNIFESDPNHGGPPSITTVETDDPSIKDILVTVRETRTGTLTMSTGLNAEGGVNLRCLLEERNFDSRQVPKSFADIAAGRVFRGAGRKLSVEVFHIAVTPGRPVSLTLLNRKLGIRRAE
jgi:outer membrane protein assembly factor BamA